MEIYGLENWEEPLLFNTESFDALSIFRSRKLIRLLGEKGLEKTPLTFPVLAKSDF